MEFRELIRPLLPPRADDRMILNVILYVLVTGSRWMNVIVRDCSYVTAWRRLKRWRREEVWKRVLKALISKGYSMGRLSLDRVALDSTTVEARKERRDRRSLMEYLP